MAPVWSDPVLRYRLDSCNSLEPLLVEENWNYPGGIDLLSVGGKMIQSRIRSIKSQLRKPVLKFYRKIILYRTAWATRRCSTLADRCWTASATLLSVWRSISLSIGAVGSTQVTYSWIPAHFKLGCSVRLVAERTYQSFLLEARGPAPRPDGNATLVGEWVRVPAISKHIHCLGRRRSAVSDKA